MGRRERSGDGEVFMLGCVYGALGVGEVSCSFEVGIYLNLVGRVGFFADRYRLVLLLGFSVVRFRG